MGGSPLGGAVNSHGDEDPCTKIFGVLRKYHKVLTIHSRALFVEDHRRTGAQAHRRTDAQTHRRTDAQTHRRTGAQAHRRTGAQAHRRTGAQAHRRTGAQAHRRTGAQAHRRTGAQAHRRAGAQARRRAGAQARRRAGAQARRRAGAQARRRAGAQPHSRTAAQPHSRTAAQPHSTAAQPHSRTAAQPVPGNPIHLERRTPPRQPSWFDTHTPNVFETLGCDKLRGIPTHKRTCSAVILFEASPPRSPPCRRTASSPWRRSPSGWGCDGPEGLDRGLRNEPMVIGKCVTLQLVLLVPATVSLRKTRKSHLPERKEMWVGASSQLKQAPSF